MKATDVDLARLAHSRGWVVEERLKRALAETDRYQAMGLEKSLDEILLECGDLSPEQARSLRDALGLNLREPRIGDYQIVRRVGVGGMGTVFEAVHVRLKRRIALKILLPRLARDPRATERFLREAKTLAKLSHPHLVHAVDAGQDGGFYYLAMDFVEGENLYQVLLREGRLDIERTVEIIRDVCEALAALEEKGLVHRDVKPSNILLAADGTVRLADFGLMAPVVGAGLGSEPLCGTPHYISPEQVRQKGDVDSRSDLYSLAASWYHILTGRPPFVGKTTREIAQCHLEVDPPPPSRIRKDVPAPVEQVILRWLAKDPAARPASPKEALVELAALSRTLRARRLLPRRMMAASFAVLGALAAILLVLYAMGARDDVPALLTRPSPPDPGMAVEPTRRIEDPPAAAQPAAAPPAAPSRAVEAPRPAGKAPGSPGPPEVPLADILSPPGPNPGPRAARSLAARAGGAFEKTRTQMSGALAPIGTRFTHLAESFAPLAGLARSFHAKLVALEPLNPPGGIILGYEFQDPEELRDFRSVPGAWVARGGVLECMSETEAEPLESLAWFVPPLSVEGELVAAGPLVVGLGFLRLAPGRGQDAKVWREEDEEAVSILAVPAAARGAWSVTFREGTVEFTSGGQGFRVQPPGSTLAGGRFVLRIAAGRPLERLRLESRLEPLWAAERLKIAAESR